MDRAEAPRDEAMLTNELTFGEQLSASAKALVDESSSGSSDSRSQSRSLVPPVKESVESLSFNLLLGCGPEEPEVTVNVEAPDMEPEKDTETGCPPMPDVTDPGPGPEGIPEDDEATTLFIIG